MTQAIETTFRRSLLDGNFDLVFAYENEDFTPTIGTPWARVVHDPLMPEAVTLSATGEDEHRGDFRLELYYPKGRGVEEINTKADEFRAYYQAGVRFTHGGQEIEIVNCGRSSGRTVEGWWAVTVTVDYWARTTRSVA